MPRGLVIVATNAGVLDTWQHKWRERARTSDRWCFHKYDRPAPWLDAKEIDEARARNSASRFARLWGGVWVSGAGDALDWDDIQRAIRLDGPSFWRREGFVHCAGLDLSTKHDRSSLVVLGCEPGHGVVELVYHETWKPGPGGVVDLQAVMAAVRWANATFRLAEVRYDPFQAALMAQQLAAEGVGMREIPFSGRNLDIMARSLLEAFRSGRIAIYRDDQVLADLTKLSITERNFGYRLSAPSGPDGHADTAFALAVALPAMLSCALEPAEPRIGLGVVRA